MDRADYEKLRAQIDRRHRDDLAALERLWLRLHEGGRPRSSPKTRGETMRLVRRAVRHLRGEFDVHDVLRKVTELAPESKGVVSTASVSMILRRLSSGGDPDRHDSDSELEMVKNGGARRPAVYRVRPTPITDAELVERL